MNEILLGVTLFTVIVLLLVFLILFARGPARFRPDPALCHRGPDLYRPVPAQCHPVLGPVLCHRAPARCHQPRRLSRGHPKSRLIQTLLCLIQPERFWCKFLQRLTRIRFAISG